MHAVFSLSFFLFFLFYFILVMYNFSFSTFSFISHFLWLHLITRHMGFWIRVLVILLCSMAFLSLLCLIKGVVYVWFFVFFLCVVHDFSFFSLDFAPNLLKFGFVILERIFYAPTKPYFYFYFFQNLRTLFEGLKKPTFQSFRKRLKKKMKMKKKGLCPGIMFIVQG